MTKNLKFKDQIVSTDVTFLPASTVTSRHSGSLPFTREKHLKNVPIIDYLSMIKSHPDTIHSPCSKVEVTTASKINKIKASRLQSQEEVFLLQKITSKRRHQKISFQNKGMSLFRKYEMTKTVEAILGIYDYYIQFGYSPSKISSIVKLHCADKKELEWIFLKKNQPQDVSEVSCFQYRSSSNEILNRLLRTIIGKKEQSREQIILDVCYFKSKIEQDLVDKGKSKMKELTVSISKQKRNLTSKIQEMSASCANINRARIHHRSLPEEQLNKLEGSPYRVEDHGNIFKVNRMLFRQWTQAQNFQ